jgi:plasmid stabilization system protein ParE
MKLRLRKVAKRDLRDAVAWYAERSDEVAERFSAEVARALELLEKFRMTGARVPGIHDSGHPTPTGTQLPVPRRIFADA